MGPPSLPSSYGILTDLAIRVQQVLEEALRESYAEEVDVDAESESDQTAAAPEIGGALSTAVAGSSSAHAADEPGTSSATFAEEAEDVRRKPGVVDEISQTDPVGSALDLCLLCATALRPSTRSVTTQTDVVLVEAERETGEVDQLSADSDDFYASIGRSSTPVQISSSLFTPQVHRTDLDTSGDTDTEALNTTDVEMTELELDDDSVADSTFSLSSRGSSDEEDDSGDELQDSGDVDDGGDSLATLSIPQQNHKLRDARSLTVKSGVCFCKSAQINSALLTTVLRIPLRRTSRAQGCFSSFSIK